MAAAPVPVIPTATHAPVSERALWFGLAGGPAAWAAHELFGWFFGARICASLTVGGVRLVVASLTLAALLVTAAALVVSRSSWQRASEVPGPPDVEAWDRKAFMAMGGVLISGVSLLAIFWAGLSSVFLQTCGWMR